jgi:hypothetical protein
MADSLLVEFGKSKRGAASLLAQTGGRALRSPVVRYVAGLPSSDLGSPDAQRPGDLSSREKPRPSTPEKPSVQDRLFKRLLFADSVGYGVPGQGILTGAAFRSSLRSLGEERGGLVGMDITDLSPEEERALPILLDPAWVDRQRRSQQP